MGLASEGEGRLGLGAETGGGIGSRLILGGVSGSLSSTTSSGGISSGELTGGGGGGNVWGTKVSASFFSNSATSALTSISTALLILSRCLRLMERLVFFMSLAFLVASSCGVGAILGEIPPKTTRSIGWFGGWDIKQSIYDTV